MKERKKERKNEGMCTGFKLNQVLFCPSSRDSINFIPQIKNPLYFNLKT